MKFMDRIRWFTRPDEDLDEDENEELDAAFPQDRRRERPSRSARVERSDRDAGADRDSMGPFSPFDTARSDQRSNKVVSIHATTQLQVVVLKPGSTKAREEIVDHLRQKHTVVLNLDSLSPVERSNLLNFISGAAYATGGQVQNVAGWTYVATPFNVNLVGDDFMDQLENNGLYNF